MCEHIGKLASAGNVPTLLKTSFDKNILWLLYATVVSDSFLVWLSLKAGTTGGFLGQDGDHSAQVVDVIKRSRMAVNSAIRRPRVLRSSS